MFRRSNTMAKRRTASLSSDSFMVASGKVQDGLPFKFFFFLGKSIHLFGTARQHP